MSEMELSKAVEFVKDRLYYVALRSIPRERSSAHFFSIDDELVYWNFFLDFGPLNLGQLYRFCQILSSKLHDKAHSGKRIYFYSGTHSHKRTNAAFLLSAYAMMYLGRSPEDAFRPFHGVYPPFPPFHDASPCVCTYNLTILDCLRGIQRARECRFFSFDSFDIDSYEYFEKVEYGDLNWIVEGKFLAFAGPHDVRSSSPEGYHTLCPDDYIPYFKKMNVTLVVRLNKKYYNEKRFTDAGIDHIDMYYLDGSTPPDHILKKFIEVCEATPGAVAVHCKAGLGRTGTCIGAYIQKHWGFTAAELIGWIRTCRPGSIIGPQQHYMKEIEAKMWAEGESYRRRKSEESRRRRGVRGESSSGSGAGAGAGAGAGSSSGRTSKDRSSRDDPSSSTTRMLKGLALGSESSGRSRSSRTTGGSSTSSDRRSRKLEAAAAADSRSGRGGSSSYLGVTGSGAGAGAGSSSSRPRVSTKASPSRSSDPYAGTLRSPVGRSSAAAVSSPGGRSDSSQGDHLRAARLGRSPAASARTSSTRYR